MKSDIELRQRVLSHVRNPIFDKPIQVRDYEKQGSIKLITKIRKNG